ncbi:MAG: UDP-N-acetylglucosamine 2-epimerase [Chitinophagales bacterium]|nr:UDP-N-acetylglucosamine 2-epimerase [Chitinophagales bacterium]
MKSKQSKKLVVDVITGSRADYGLLMPAYKAMQQDSDFEPRWIVTGTHLERSFGNTVQVMEKDGFGIFAKVKLNIKETTPTLINTYISKAVDGFSKQFTSQRPDAILVLGDRYEIFAAAIAAYVLQIPVMHIHGGETSAGAFDEGFRHSISKLSYLHFVTCDTHKQRLQAMGEQPKRVFNVGALAVDNIRNFSLLSKEALSADLGIDLNGPSALLTYHPVTLEPRTSHKQLMQLFDALNKLPELAVIFNTSNADTDGDILNKAICDFVANRPNTVLVPSLGTQRFLSVLSNVDLMIGNSSAGLIEMPYFKHPTINIGDRQKGRMKPATVIDCTNDTAAIVKAIRKGLSPVFVKECKKVKYPFGKGNTAQQMLRIMKRELVKVDLKKVFFDKEVYGI